MALLCCMATAVVSGMAVAPVVAVVGCALVAVVALLLSLPCLLRSLA